MFVAFHCKKIPDGVTVLACNQFLGRNDAITNKDDNFFLREWKV